VHLAWLEAVQRLVLGARNTQEPSQRARGTLARFVRLARWSMLGLYSLELQIPTANVAYSLDGVDYALVFVSIGRDQFANVW